ncbi:MAG: DUF1566 domain-containing protein [Myxococcaceae bacterium]|nr:DUF1566 domain-containing protein [Myxococcaceae bacterium]
MAAKIGYVALLPNGTIPSPLPSTPVPIPTSTSVPTSPTTGLLAAWNQASGIYADGTNQTARYNISNGVVIDTLSSIQWEQAESANTMSWSSVSDYCASQTTGGFSDWRAPNIGELQTLVDFTVGYPNVPINATAFPNTSYINFWSSTQVSGSSAYNWVVLLSRYGGTQSDSNTTLDLVRCVRSSYPVPFPTRYTLTSGVVTDTVTGLIWQQHAPTIPYSQPGANTYCNSLSLGDFTFGWRLPTIKELSSLVDFNVSPPGLMMDPAAFAGEPLSWYWSSTPQAGFSGMTWFVDFSGDAELSVVIGYTNNRYSVRCVHDPAT